MDSTSLGGRLIVATPSLIDPNFRRSVVLMLHHDDQGALGVVLNRPSEVTVRAALRGWDRLAAQPPVVFVGGPVETQGVIALARRDSVDEADGWQQVMGGLGVLDLRRDPETLRVERVRLFAGHAGWAGGQLEDELAAGSWFVLDADGEDAFCAEPQGLWRQVLRRQGGVFRTFPEDPGMN